MTTAPAAENPRLALAAEAVDLGLRACAAYGRADLAARLEAAQRTLADPAVHIVVAGEFKQGKSSLVNALIGATVCPVDDDVATAVPDLCAARPGAPGDAAARPGRGRRTSANPSRWTTCAGMWSRVSTAATATTAWPGSRSGCRATCSPPDWCLWTLPGVGGLGSAHAAASLAAISSATRSSSSPTPRRN